MKRFSGLPTNKDSVFSCPALSWRQACYPAAALLAGLITAQIIAALQVHVSNRELYRTLALISDAGYLPLPNHVVMDSLPGFESAFYGALFFTLSVGAGVSLIALTAAWAWDRVLSRRRIPLVVGMILWSGMIGALNWNGFCPFVSAYGVFIPIPVFWVAVKWMPPHSQRGARQWGWVHVATLFLLAGLWAPQMENRLFVNIRDYLLLSNDPGAKIVDFYYRFTLYPAQVFKSLTQKTLKTCTIDPAISHAARVELERALRSRDWLFLKKSGLADLNIRSVDDNLILGNRGGSAVLQIPVRSFLTTPDDALDRFSSKTDRYALFRHVTYCFVLTGFPVALYLMLHTAFLLPLCRWLRPGTAFLTASIFCFLAGLLLLMALWMGNAKMGEEPSALALASSRWQDRVAALKMLHDTKQDVTEFPVYRDLLSSPRIPERYWLAKALGVSRNPEVRKDILGLLDDPSQLVASMAFQALGRTGDRSAVPLILKHIETSCDWYPQWYAYRALKRLGWKQ